MTEQLKMEAKMLLLIQESEYKGKISRLRVVQWLVNGALTYPKIEKREFYTNQDNVECTGKCMPLGIKDLELLIEHIDDIRVAVDGGENEVRAHKAAKANATKEAQSDAQPKQEPKSNVPF